MPKNKNNEETTQSFPLIEEIESVEEVMERTCELLQSAHHNGAVLVRRLPLQTEGDFDALLKHSNYQTSPTKNPFLTRSA